MLLLGSSAVPSDLVASSVSTTQHIVSVIIGILLFLGTFVCYLPQVFTLIKSRSAHGVSFLTCYACSLTNFSNFVSLAMRNMRVMLFWWDTDLNRDLVIDGFEVVDAVLNCLTVLVGFAFPLAILSLVVKYGDVEEEEGLVSQKKKRREMKKKSVMLLLQRILYCGLVGYMGFIWPLGMSLQLFERAAAEWFSKVMATIASVGQFVVWTPQILVTCCARGPGSVNLVTLAILIVGTLALAMYLLIAGQNWMNWLPYLFAVAQQSIVMLLVIVFAIWKRCHHSRDYELVITEREIIDKIVEDSGLLDHPEDGIVDEPLLEGSDD